MKFGKEFRIHLEETLPEWRDKFLCYKPLKKLLKHLPNTTISGHNNNNNPQNRQSVGNHGEGGPSSSESVPTTTQRSMSLEEFQDWFVRLLNDELDKLNDFYVEKEEDFVIRFQVLHSTFILFFQFLGDFRIMVVYECFCYSDFFGFARSRFFLIRPKLKFLHVYMVHKLVRWVC